MKNFLPTFSVTALTILLLVSFIIDGMNVQQGGSIDYRNRVTGARLLVVGINPYTYKWVRADDPIYCDVYNNPHQPVSKTTATPALLALAIPLAELPYRLDQYLWFASQWALLLGAAYLWWRRCRDFRQRVLLGVMVTGLTYTAAWRLHVERGQSYVLLLFFFAFWLAGTLNPQTRQRFLTGLAAGFLMTLRPPFVLLFPFLAWKARGQLTGVVTGLLIGLIVPMFFSLHIWPDYFSAMQTQSHLYRFDINPRPGPQSYPPEIEGMPTDLLANFVAIPYADFSMHSLLRALGAEPFSAELVFLGGLTLFAAWFWWARNQNIGRVLLGLAIWMFLLDLFLPAYRNTYNDILVVNIFALRIVTVARLSPALILGLLALACGGVIYVLAPEHDWIINLPSGLLTVSVLLFFFVPPSGPKLDRTPGSVQNQAC